MKLQISVLLSRLFLRPGKCSATIRLPGVRLGVVACESREAAGSLLDFLFGTLNMSAAPGETETLPAAAVTRPFIRPGPIGLIASQAAEAGIDLNPSVPLWSDAGGASEPESVALGGHRSDSTKLSGCGVGLDDSLWTGELFPAAVAWRSSAPDRSSPPGGSDGATDEPFRDVSLKSGAVSGVDSVAATPIVTSPALSIPFAAKPAATSVSSMSPTEAILSAKLREVTFSGAGLITIEADPGEPAYASPPHWYDGDLNGVIDQPGDRSLPIGYPRGDTVTVSARFKAIYTTVPAPPPQDFRVRGADSMGQTIVPSTPVQLESGDLVLNPTAMSRPLPNYVDYVGGFLIGWQFSYNGGSSWTSAGTSQNQMYVTLEGTGINPVFHSPIHHFCTAAMGMDNEADSILKAWKPFEDRTVKTQKGETLHYYKRWDWGDNNKTAEDLLKHKDGTCYSWAYYLRMVLQTGGVKNTAIEQYFIASATAPENVHMLIKDWSFVGNGTSGNPQYPYQNTLKDPAIRPLANPASIMKNEGGVWSYVWGNTVEMADGDGIPGQATSNPRSLFQNHVVVRLGGIDFYDPSYGKKYATIQAWEDAALAGLVTEQVDNTTPDTATFRLVGRKPNAGVPDVASQKTNW